MVFLAGKKKSVQIKVCDKTQGVVVFRRILKCILLTMQVNVDKETHEVSCLKV